MMGGNDDPSLDSMISSIAILLNLGNAVLLLATIARVKAILKQKTSNNHRRIVSIRKKYDDTTLGALPHSSSSDGISKNGNSVDNDDVWPTITYKVSPGSPRTRQQQKPQLELNNKKVEKDKPIQRQLCFAHIEIRRYPTVVGDHPCCRVGCPLSFGWEYTDTTHNTDAISKGVEQRERFTVDQYEATRSSQRYRNREDLRISWQERRQLLLKIYTEQELRYAERRHQRSLLSCNMQSKKELSAFFQQDFFQKPVPPPVVTC